MAKTYVSVNSLSTSDREKLKKNVKEIADSMLRASAEGTLQKDVLKAVSEELGVEKKIIRAMAKTYVKSNFNNIVEDFNVFEDFFEVVMNGNTTTASAP
jgi:hypothetical protein